MDTAPRPSLPVSGTRSERQTKLSVIERRGHQPPPAGPEPTGPPPAPSDAGRRSRGRIPNDTLWDQDLRRAKNANLTVTFWLPFELDFCIADGSCKARVIVVDKFAVKFEVRLPSAGAGGTQQVWIRKDALIAVEVPR